MGTKYRAIKQAIQTLAIGPHYAQLSRVEELTYREFKSGLTYQDVVAMMWVDSDDSSQWHRKSRGAVLRLWGQLKADMWAAATGGLYPDEIYRRYVPGPTVMIPRATPACSGSDSVSADSAGALQPAPCLFVSYVGALRGSHPAMQRRPVATVQPVPPQPPVRSRDPTAPATVVPWSASAPPGSSPHSRFRVSGWLIPVTRSHRR